ncbi:UPF0234 protein [Alphaproteobacteria bacterium]|nr:UPF0234 protein [Alphaproteobacteria bacterium]
MPSFDVVSKINIQEIDNAVNTVLRELTNRYDFKGSIFSVELKTKDNLIILTADSDYKLSAIQESLKASVSKRGIDARALDFQKEQPASGQSLRQEVKLRNGIEQEIAKEIVKDIKQSKLKVQTSIKGDELRVDGKKRDDLQEVILFLKKTDYKIPLQFINFRE